MYEKHNFINDNGYIVLDINSVTGNIFGNRRLSEKYRRAKASGKCELLLVSRMDMERLRLRRRTDMGTDIGLVLEPGNKLNHGDVLAAKDRFIMVEQLPEKVMSVRIQKCDIEKMVGLAALIGHTIGNRHRPIAIDHHGTISFPVQAESEVEIFRMLLPTGVKLKVTEQIFLPTGGVHVHE